jgi:acylphosphatase
MERRVVRITGHVQGVSFRQGSRREALCLGLRGFARNNSDGSVTVDVEGDPRALEQLVAWCHRGPKLAVVEHVHVDALDPVGYSGFAIE